ncbi:hypothetical protein [Streptomyces sp. NPDC127038]|uniref:VMAP-C domain-containing protein n=1 Tax=Streptomyces sp. NPDC127038 TaxID=3347114 RepID=UPI00364CC939
MQAEPWSQSTADLLCDVLLRFEKMQRLEFRLSVLGQMAKDERSRDINHDVSESSDPRIHIRAIIGVIATRADPVGVLESLTDSLTVQAPYDGAMPWLKLIVLTVANCPPPISEQMLSLIKPLRALTSQPRPQKLHAYLLGSSKGVNTLRGNETLPEILARLADLRGDPNLTAMFRFLRSFSSDVESPVYEELEPVRDVLARMRIHCNSAGEGDNAPSDGYRLIVQIRVEPEDAEHEPNGRYRLNASFYRQGLSGGRLERVGSLGQVESFSKNELIGEGSARLTRWADLAREFRSSASGHVRIEFLLPTSLLSHPAELWSTGATRRPLGQHHPVVIRSLERYIDAWLDTRPWRERWNSLQQKEGEVEVDALDLIGWPVLESEKAAEFTRWVAARPALACLGLSVPYNELDPAMRDAVDDAIFTEGMPVLLWRRDKGAISELLDALREIKPNCLTDLPVTVHMCRRGGRVAGPDDVRNNITLLWDDPDCLDPDQDTPFAGMI